MDIARPEEVDVPFDPLEVVEHVLTAENLPFDRTDEGDLAFALAGGCPGRQLFMAGEGDNDAAVFAVGLIVGTAVAHNFGLASSPTGVGPHGMAATLAGLAICLCIGFFNCKRGA